MKIRSRALYTYLFENGVLNGTPEEIDRAKCEYRKRYKQQWKRRRRPRKELRIEFTLKQFEQIKAKAQQQNLRPTPYARLVIQTAVQSTTGIITTENLLPVLQLVSRAAIAALKKPHSYTELADWLTQAETLLLQHIQRIQF